MFDRLAIATGFNDSWMSVTYPLAFSSTAVSIIRPSCIRAKYVEFCNEFVISSFSRRISSSSSSNREITASRSHRTFSPNSILSRIFSSTSSNARYVDFSSSTMSSCVRKIVPKDIGITVKSRITVSFTSSCASTFSRVGS